MPDLRYPPEAPSAPHNNGYQRQRPPRSDDRARRESDQDPPGRSAGSAALLIGAAAAAHASQSTSGSSTDAGAPRAVVVTEAAAVMTPPPIVVSGTMPSSQEDSMELAVAPAVALDFGLAAADAMPQQQRYHEYRVAPHYHAPIHPVVLCHGLFGFDKIGPESFPHLQVHYWRGISDALRDIGCQVWIARVPSTGSVHTRAEALRNLLQRNNLTHVNMVAHSMGGLDCRYLVSRLGLPTDTHVHSLTTISTPHRGSPVMDWFASVLGLGKELGLGDDHPHSVALRQLDPYATHPLARLMRALDFPAYGHLTTWYAEHLFNPNVPDVPDVQYYSYGASYPIPVYAPLRIPYEVIKAREGENDGMVSIESAKWGTYLGTVPADHWGLNNRWLSSKLNPEFDAVGFYLSVATKLWKEGL
ncbi:hypothetical protein GGF31_003360 [Allomyces arbusculus]|nr:hypothetical protein GGF31_003360 [Allomyces arbusculus]